MKYKELNEMTFKDWDGKQFRAIVIDDDEYTLYHTDEARRDGREEGLLVIGYINGRWYTDDRILWKHVYPIEWNEKPKKRMTNRQLAMWLAKGNGVLWKSECNHLAFTSHNYVIKYADTEVMDDWKVRKWDSEEWVEPTTDLLEEC